MPAAGRKEAGQSALGFLGTKQTALMVLEGSTLGGPMALQLPCLPSPSHSCPQSPAIPLALLEAQGTCDGQGSWGQRDDCTEPSPRQPSSFAAEWALAWSLSAAAPAALSGVLSLLPKVRGAHQDGWRHRCVSRRGAGVLRVTSCLLLSGCWGRPGSGPLMGPFTFLVPEVLTPQEPSLTVVLQSMWVSQCAAGVSMRPGCPCKASAAMVGRGAGGSLGTHPQRSPTRDAGTFPFWWR